MIAAPSPLSPPLASRMPSLAHRLALRVSRAIFRPAGSLVWGLHFRGGESLPASGAVIVCANHASLLDPIVLQAACPRPLRFLMHSDFFYWTPLRWASWLFEAVPVERSHGGSSSLRRAGRLLDEGEAVGIFPEGGVSPDGRLKSFRSGAAILALRHGAPLVPAWIEGTHAALPRHARLPRRSRISITIGHAIPVRPVGDGEVEDADVLRLTEILRAAVESLAPSVEPADRIVPRDR